jgi:hypothetical protein
MITVKVDGVVQRWAWKSEGVECTVVEPNTEENNA